MKLKKSGFESFIRLSSSSPVTEESIKDHVKSSSSFKNMQEIGQTLDKNYVIACSCHKVNDDLLLSILVILTGAVEVYTWIFCRGDSG